MTIYRYKALTPGGLVVTGKLEAVSKQALSASLYDQGISLISFAPVRRLSFFERPIRLRSLRELCLHLEQCAKAGLPLKESVAEMAAIQDSPKLKTILEGVGRDLESGRSLSASLAKYPAVFDAVFVGVVRVGETTGQLALSFEQLGHHLKWVDEVQTQLIKALRYPLMMLILLGVVIYTLLSLVVPELVTFIQSTAVSLPFSTRLFIHLSEGLAAAFRVIVPFLLGGGLGVSILFKYHPKGADWKGRFQQKLPFLGSLQTQFSLVRFCHLFAILFGSGIDVLQSLQTAREGLSPGVLPHAVRRVEYLVREGSSLSSAFEQVAVFPPLVVRMIRMGERTSALGQNLFHVKEYVDAVFKRRIDHLLSLLGPAMILVLGLLMGWIVYAIFLPLYDTLLLLDVS